MDSNFYSAITKCERFHGEWTAYLTPSELMAIWNTGDVTVNHKWTIPEAIAAIKAGKCNPKWYYFTIRGKLYTELNNNRKQSSVHTKVK